MKNQKLGLDDAYSVESPDDNRALYRDWAATYESDFAISHGWIYPEGIARLFASRIENSENRDPLAAVLDVGSGTGAVGVELAAHGVSTIDGIDISPEMLALASQKRCYRWLVEADVTQPLPVDDGAYGGVVSAGTFTHGHLGPEPLHELVRVGAPGAVYAIGINSEHYLGRGFARVLDGLVSARQITEPDLEEIAMYQGEGAGEHANDMATVALFQRL